MKGSPSIARTVLRDYQSTLVDKLYWHLTCGNRSVLLNSPTGSGKSLMLLTVLAQTLGLHYSHALIATPQIQIEDGFLGGEDRLVVWPPEEICPARSRLIAAGLVRRARDGEDAASREILDYLQTADPGYALAVTYDALRLSLRKHRDEFPADLSQLLLLIDEYHHSAAVGLGGFLDFTESRGAALIGATATAARGDDREILRPHMEEVVWSLAQHMAIGQGAPSRIQNAFVPVGGAAGSPIEDDVFSGRAAPRSAGQVRAFATALVKRWQADGQPRSFVRVPPIRGGSAELIRTILGQFHAAGARVLDGTGTDPECKRQFRDALKTERARAYRESQYDIVLICQRYEGTDWPLANTIYVVGLPGSLPMVIQLLGRCLRHKNQPDYPATERDLARIVFLVPTRDGETLDHLSWQHSQHAALVACCLHDLDAGLLWMIEKHLGRGPGLDSACSSPADSKARRSSALGPDVAAIFGLDPGRVAAARLGLAGFQEEHPDATSEEIIQGLQADGFQADEIDAAVLMTAMANRELKPRLEAALAREMAGVAESMRARLSRIVAHFRSETLESDQPALIALGGQVHQLTSKSIRDVSRRIARAGESLLDQQRILRAVDIHWERHQDLPVFDRNLAPETGFTWSRIAHWSLKYLGKPLASLIRDHRPHYFRGRTIRSAG